MKKFSLSTGNAWKALSRDQMKAVAGGLYDNSGTGGGNINCSMIITYYDGSSRVIDGACASSDYSACKSYAQSQCAGYIGGGISGCGSKCYYV